MKYFGLFLAIIVMLSWLILNIKMVWSGKLGPLRRTDWRSPDGGLWFLITMFFWGISFLIAEGLVAVIHYITGFGVLI